jgi:glyoxylase-like metal-dependent hydrolase (beta-lactamase superfamily II)
MIEEVLPNLFRVEVPLPGNPLKAINSYVIKAKGQNLIIDTGMNRDECISVINSALKKLNINLSETDFFITHFHSDHLGLVSNLATDTSIVYFNRKDAEFMRRIGEYRNSLLIFARMNGFPENELLEALKKHPGYRYGARGPLEFTILREGNTISIGDYLFECVETPGHTGGHMCLYEPNRKIFLAGDHILEDITPNISLWSDQGNPLEEYLASLDKVYNFDVSVVLPGHRRIFRDFRKRIRELKKHYQRRVEEVIDILKKGRKNAYQIAAEMEWDVDYGSWELFPTTQKWFAVGETISYLRYLEEKGVIRKRLDGEVLLFEV